MPIVNKANYVSCPSCGKWMHRLPLADYGRTSPNLLALQQGQLTGNRAHICQECYEGADGIKARGNLHLSDAEYAQGLAAQAESDARATEDKRIDPPTDDEVSNCVAAWIDAGPGLFGATKAIIEKFIELRSKKS